MKTGFLAYAKCPNGAPKGQNFLLKFKRHQKSSSIQNVILSTKKGRNVSLSLSNLQNVPMSSLVANDLQFKQTSFWPNYTIKNHPTLPKKTVQYKINNGRQPSQLNDNRSEFFFVHKIDRCVYCSHRGTHQLTMEWWRCATHIIEPRTKGGVSRVTIIINSSNNDRFACM